MTTLFDLTWRVAVELGVSKTGVASGGATNTIVDVDYLKAIDNDYFNEGTAWVLSAGAAAPEGEFGVVDNYDSNTKTIEMRDAFTVAVAAADKYGVATGRYPLLTIIQKINSALFSQGYIPVTDTSLTTAVNTRQFTMPKAATLELRQVLVQTNSVSGNEQWEKVFNWEIEHTATDTADILHIPYDLPSGMSIMLRYAARHADMRLATSVLNQSIHPDRIVYRAAHDLMRDYRDRTRLRHLGDTIKDLLLRAEDAERMHPLPTLPARQARLTLVSRTLGSDRHRSRGGWS